MKVSETPTPLKPLAFCLECKWKDPGGEGGIQAGRAHTATEGHAVSVVESLETIIRPPVVVVTRETITAGEA